MKYLASFLGQFSGGESLPQGTDRTAKSPAGTSDAVLEAVPASTPGEVCDDCGWECTVTLVTDYGARYCRRCLRHAPLTTAKGRSHA